MISKLNRIPTITKRMYSRTKLAPRALFIFRLQDTMQTMADRSMRTSNRVLQLIPSELTAAGAKPWLKE